MSLLIVAALALANSTPTPQTRITARDWRDVSTSARRMNIPPRTLYRALTAPQAPRRVGQQARYCIPLATIAPGKSGMVCHTRQRWASYGLDVPTRHG